MPGTCRHLHHVFDPHWSAEQCAAADTGLLCGDVRSVDGARLRIAEVTRGDLVRALSAAGRAVAANSPTRFAVAGGAVPLPVVAGDVFKHAQGRAPAPGGWWRTAGL